MNYKTLLCQKSFHSISEVVENIINCQKVIVDVSPKVKFKKKFLFSKSHLSETFYFGLS